MPLIASRLSRTPTVCSPRHAPAAQDPGVDLEVEVPMRITGPRGEVTHDGGLDLLDRHLHLPAPRTDPGRRVLGQPADDLGRGTILGSVVRRRDLRVQRGRDRPRLRPVDRDLDEPHRLVVVAQPALRRAGARRRSRRPTARTSRRPCPRGAGRRPAERLAAAPARSPRPGSSRRHGTGRPRRSCARQRRCRGRSSARRAPENASLTNRRQPYIRRSRRLPARALTEIRSMRAAR